MKFILRSSKFFLFIVVSGLLGGCFSFFAKPTVTENGLEVKLEGCTAKARSVICRFSLMSMEFDKTVRFRSNTSFDDLGNQYSATKLSLANKTGNDITHKLIAEVKTEATIQFDNISTRASKFSQLQLHFGEDMVQFRDVSF